MRIERRFTKQGQSAYAEIEFRKALSEIKNPDGSESALRNSISA